ncbi:TetR/AcrR family transcriptional regulator [Nonomuraea sp. B12E4]|uniref:TetR/AcrR family transcriptional regulator n=1 Tax=Nonomuraea sp. B12E4 TaxID=3153564 RepID=UPI00325D6B52
MAASARRGTPLTLQEISATAVRMVDEGGVEALSMRKLAAELDVNPMSLYHHVESKDALLELLCDTVADRMRMPPDDGSPWQEQLRALAVAYYQHAQDHRAMWGYIHEHPELVADRRQVVWQTLYRIMRLAGVPEPELRRTSDVLHAFVSGFIYAEVQGHFSDDPEEIARMFDTAIDVIIHGLQGGSRTG